MTRPLRRRARGEAQALVEFAITLPLFALFVMVVIQLSLIFIAYYSETRMARESARWLAINSRTSDDDDLAAHVQATMLPGLVNAAPTNLVYGTSGVDATADVGQMHLKFTPCEWNGTVCTHATRASGTTLYVEMRYDIANSRLVFLPTTFRMGSLVVAIPTQLPAYRVYTMVE